MNVIDLFAGAGGLTEGFFKEGFNIVAHVEKDKWACETLKTRICYHYLKKENDLELYNEYIKKANDYRKIDLHRNIIFDKYPKLKKKLEYEVLNKTFGDPNVEEGTTGIDEMINLIEKSLKYNKKKSVDVIIGGPPCQAYSLVGRGRMKEQVKDDNRNYLFKYYKEIVKYFNPKIFIFENVPGILSAGKGKIFTSIEEEFRNIGYKILSGKNKDHKKNILNGYDFGVPQNRERLILFGVRNDLNFEYPDFTKNANNFGKTNTLDAIGDLPHLKPGQGNDYFFKEYDETNENLLNKFQKLMRECSIGVINHNARSHQKRDLEIYKIAIKKSKQGERLKYNDLPEKYKTHKNEKTFTDRFKVHFAKGIPHTIVAHISKDGHYNIHPDINQCRSLTVREAARIQSFPDNYKFEGPRTQQFVQVGNAVPPLMSEAIAKTIKMILNKKKIREYSAK